MSAGPSQVDVPLPDRQPLCCSFFGWGSWVLHAFGQLRTLEQLFRRYHIVTVPAQWVQRIVQSVIFYVSEREIDDAALVVAHQSIKACNQIFLGGLLAVSPGARQRPVAPMVFRGVEGGALTRRGPFDLTNPGFRVGIAAEDDSERKGGGKNTTDDGGQDE